MTEFLYLFVLLFITLFHSLMAIDKEQRYDSFVRPISDCQGKREKKTGIHAVSSVCIYNRVEKKKEV